MKIGVAASSIMNIALTAFFLSVVALFVIERVTVIPDAAHVIVERDSGTYFSDRCASNDEWESHRKFTVAEAKTLGFKPNPQCRNMGGFAESRRLLFHLLGARPRWE